MRSLRALLGLPACARSCKAGRNREPRGGVFFGNSTNLRADPAVERVLAHGRIAMFGAGLIGVLGSVA